MTPFRAAAANQDAAFESADQSARPGRDFPSPCRGREMQVQDAAERVNDATANEGKLCPRRERLWLGAAWAWPLAWPAGPGPGSGRAKTFPGRDRRLADEAGWSVTQPAVPVLRRLNEKAPTLRFGRRHGTANLCQSASGWQPLAAAGPPASTASARGLQRECRSSFTERRAVPCRCRRICATPCRC